MPYTWKNNIACTAVYKIMERDDRMNQFEAIVIPFDDAKSLKISDLPFFPSASSADVAERAAKQFGATFFKFVAQDYVVYAETSTERVRDMFNAIVNVLMNPNKTLLDLAEIVDSKLIFSDERDEG
ncbi:hypothetical protein [Marinagarivorans cellulosilyticus]|uniref:Uncharacterized protein n=1 Tax=Marinagarivorans cellulosilyticus TaxID=2721545 RepID=A0AAN2BM63_9GAMM|nr:hypothetical protein [Marinagarivorans cellulosilyticus]BCD99843.1 hypothetical protein MARGE09_P4045 [Marinagarivorans cellulosilyticus]